MATEDTSLLSSDDSNEQQRQKRIFHVFCIVVATLGLTFAVTRHGPSAVANSAAWITPKLRAWEKTKKIESKSSTTEASIAYAPVSWNPPAIEERCEWVIQKFQEREVGSSPRKLKLRYLAQSQDFNVFYRATASLFWQDFVGGHWENGLLLSLHEDATLIGGMPVTRMSTWTWVTGDQHLSNFGAWRNRHQDIVFGVNDFDESAIYDFQVDILRVAVSVFNHGVTNELSYNEIKRALAEFTDTYVKTVLHYVGNDDALDFELTKDTTHGDLKKFLEKLESHNSRHKQLRKFTERTDSGKVIFRKGPIGEPPHDTRLEAVSPEREKEIRESFTSTKYGSTMMKLGWAVREWSDDYFKVLDVSKRVGSGIGSYGVDRYYVLIKGTDELVEDEDMAVVLDVKYQPNGAFWSILTEDEKAWYKTMFPNSAARTIEAQRKLTSYTDPYLGWIVLNDESGVPQPFSVRQRSPWKDSTELDDLESFHEFSEFMAEVAVATATSHVRGSVSKADGDFKHVIKALLKNKKDREEWGDAVLRLAAAYHKQVILDFDCFADYVKAKYPSEP